jgi:hypothetical protein
MAISVSRSRSVLDQTTDTTPEGPFIYTRIHTVGHTYAVIYGTVMGRWEPWKVDEVRMNEWDAIANLHPNFPALNS